MKKFYMFLLALLILPSFALSQNYFKVRGTVTDDKGTTLAGANIFNQMYRIGTATDADGKYILEIPKTIFKGTEIPEFTLEARFVGYKTVSEAISLSKDEITQDFSLHEDILNLESILVTPPAG